MDHLWAFMNIRVRNELSKDAMRLYGKSCREPTYPILKFVELTLIRKIPNFKKQLVY